MKVVCVAVIKDEGPYLKDWLEWHWRLGISHFYLYDACTDPKTFEVLMPWAWRDIVTLIPAIGRPIQWESYTNAFSRLQTKCDWTLVIDADEYLVLKKHNNVQEFLSQYLNPIGSVSVGWSCFGSSGALKEDLSVPLWQRFTHRAPYDNESPNPHTRHVKSFVRPDTVHMVGDPHIFQLKRNYICVDPKGKPIHSSEHKIYPTDEIVLNHYVLKSYQEWERKVTRGSADIHQFNPARRRKLEDFHDANKHCTIEDRCAIKMAERIFV
jgi:hypothetical protein